MLKQRHDIIVDALEIFMITLNVEFESQRLLPNHKNQMYRPVMWTSEASKMPSMNELNAIAEKTVYYPSMRRQY
jgi:hypothetical protein